MRGDTAEVSHAWQGDIHQAVQERPHAVATQGNFHPDRPTFTQLKVRDTLTSLGDDRLLTGALGHIANSRVEGLGVIQGFPDTDVYDNFFDPRDLHDIVQAQ